MIMILINYYENANKTGIYCIKNLVNNKIYIGSTKAGFATRKNRHLRNLRNNSHYNEHMQNSWNYYGDENFSFEVLFLCPPEECEKYEGEFIKLYKSNDRKYGYNIASVTSYKFEYNLSNREIEQRSDRKKIRAVTVSGFNSTERGLTKAFKVYDIEGNFIIEYNSAKEYSEKHNVCARGSLSTILTKRKLIYNKQIVLFSNDKLTIDDISDVKKRLAKRKVCLYDLDDYYIKTFDSVIECAKFLNCKVSEVRMCCSGKRSRIKQYVTKYLKD